MLAPNVSVPATSTSTPPPSDKITIELVSVFGSGCPKNTANIVVSPDNTAFTVTYSAYLAQSGAGTKPSDGRKNCQLALNVHVPGGFTYAIASVDYRGYADVPKGATTTQRANYYFQGDPQTVHSQKDFKGPFRDDFERTDSVDVAALVWAPCGVTRYFNINTELRADIGKAAKDETAIINMDSTDASIGTKYHFAWDTCNHHARR
jgi:Domain of unknown function (DUF4360)